MIYDIFAVFLLMETFDNTAYNIRPPPTSPAALPAPHSTFRPPPSLQPHQLHKSIYHPHPPTHPSNILPSLSRQTDMQAGGSIQHQYKKHQHHQRGIEMAMPTTNTLLASSKTPRFLSGVFLQQAFRSPQID